MSEQQTRPPVVVVFGGISEEHDVSVLSGTAIAAALASKAHSVRQVLIDLDGGWWWLPADHARAGRSPSTYDDPPALGATGPLAPGAAADRLASESPVPVVFVALHGPGGEDGTVQGLLESVGVPYTGAGVTASALAMDKARFKLLARASGLPVVEWTEVGLSRWTADRPGVLAEVESFARALAEPRLMVKPARLGSSVGMTIAHRADERAAALDEAFRHDDVALVERYLERPRELEVAVLGEPEAALAFGPGEIVPGREFYDYVAKYLSDAARTFPVADLPEPVAARVRELALRAFRLVGADGFARVDFLLSGERLYVSEVNTIPGFTSISLYPQMAAAGGLALPELCERIVELALRHQAVRRRRRLRPRDLPR